MTGTAAEGFYTGLVADLYSPLKSTSFAPAHYSELIARYGEPALELGCGDGDPLLDLRGEGLDVDGLDSSPDMIERLHQRAEERNLDVTAWVATMQDIHSPRKYTTVFLAGPTFNLLPDDAAMAQALASIHRALDDGGTAVVPLFVPEPVPPEQIGVPVRQETATGWMGWQVVAAVRDEESRTQTQTLKYEREVGGAHDQIQRDWIIHWIDVTDFSAAAGRAGLETVSAPQAIGHRPADVVLRR